MFDKEFFPTPKSIIRKMIKPYNLIDCTVLEPSAGKGDILDYIKENSFDSNNVSEFKPYCIEKNYELRYILQEKKYAVIGEDFLNYNGDYFFDLIVMNPPFSKSEDHLLKAWEILDGGDIVCLLNSETITNPYTEKRKLLLNIISEHGTVENLGNCFTDAERKTGVNTVMIRLKKKTETSKLDFKFESVNKGKEFRIDESILNNPIATQDVIGNMVIQLDRLKENFVEYLKFSEAMEFYSQGLLNSDYLSISKIISACKGSNRQRFNQFCDLMKANIWSMVIHKIGMDKYMTENVRKNFLEFIARQGTMDFTKENVESLIKTLFVNRISILETAIIDVFDIFTKYHKENRCHIEGWKTNDKWKVNKKIILPGWVRWGEYSSQGDLKQHGDRISTNYRSDYEDIDKVMCYLTGTKLEEVSTLKSCLDAQFRVLGYIRIGDKFDNTGESEFFKYKFWRKGTLHIEFKDRSLWEEFNMRACAGKQWLPEAEKKEWESKKYQILVA